uniref:Uncharacterized protein n=1 Tax=Arundo donax TaxID=35708 RepID=A0A0A9D059_ARUDO
MCSSSVLHGKAFHAAWPSSDQKSMGLRRQELSESIARRS